MDRGGYVWICLVRAHSQWATENVAHFIFIHTSHTSMFLAVEYMTIAWYQFSSTFANESKDY